MKTLIRVALTVTNLVLFAGLIAAVSLPEEEAAAPVHVRKPTAWAPPTWFPEQGRDALWVLPELAGEGEATGPRVRARAAIVADLDTGRVLWSRDPDGLWPVASMTKLVSGLTLGASEPDLDRELCVTPELWPGIRGARSKFITGACHQGWEYVGAALVKSDNRGAMAFAPLAGLDHASFVDRMYEVSAELGMGEVEWTDPAGLADENMATARGMLKAVVAAAAHPVVAVPSTAPSWTIHRQRGPQELSSTNKLRERWNVLAAKTGYTSTAGWCFAQAIETDAGQRLATVVMGAPTDGARWQDTRRLVEHAERLTAK